ncbi:MAG: hypothetical protein K2M19_05565 [Muribaculaceae bacterium]|nr:hypothetical protein [Muribaculaceae bacterium]
MKQPTTQQIVEKIADDYRRAGKALAHAAERNGGMSGFMNQANMDADAEAIMAAYNAGNFENVPASDVDKLMEKYGSADIYHLTASYFTSTGKILNVE